MVRPRVLLFLVLGGAFISMVRSCPAASAESPSIFGPVQFVRGTGAPQEFTRAFDDCAPAARFKIIVINGHPDGSVRVSSASIGINGRPVFGPSDFNQNVARLEKAVSLSKHNELRVHLASKPGSLLTLSVECSANCPSGPQATSDGNVLTFATASCQIVSSVPLTNERIVNPTPEGDVTNITHEWANISDDRGHAGVYTTSFAVNPTNGPSEAFVTGTFTYYGSSGRLWQLVAPLGTNFVTPIGAKDPRVITPDGSRVLLISAGQGLTNPIVSVYDADGKLLYQSAGVFLELDQAHLSPIGRYVLIVGIVKSNNNYNNLIRVIDLSSSLSADLDFDIVAGGMPAIDVSGDGRFLISYQGTQVVLP